MIVLDASALINALTDDGPRGVAARGALRADSGWIAPDHLPVEVFQGVRGQHRRGLVASQRARDALAALVDLRVELAPVAPLIPRMWELRENVSGYDAAYVALAEMLGCPLVTADIRLTRAPGLRCEVILAI